MSNIGSGKFKLSIRVPEVILDEIELVCIERNMSKAEALQWLLSGVDLSSLTPPEPRAHLVLHVATGFADRIRDASGANGMSMSDIVTKALEKKLRAMGRLRYDERVHLFTTASRKNS